MRGKMREGIKPALEIVCFTGPLVLVIALLVLGFPTWSILAAAGSCLVIHGAFWLRASRQWTHVIREFETKRAQRDLPSSRTIDRTSTDFEAIEGKRRNGLSKKLVDS